MILRALGRRPATLAEETPVLLDPFLPEPSVMIFRGIVHCSSLSALLAQVERERRRLDAVAAFAPHLLPFVEGNA